MKRTEEKLPASFMAEINTEKLIEVEKTLHRLRHSTLYRGQDEVNEDIDKVIHFIRQIKA